MSDNSSSTGSSRSGSLTTSWTMLSPEEAAEIVDPVDGGTECLCDVPSLSEEVTGATEESKPSDQETPIETVLSEEGQQEMAPDTCEGPVPSRPTLLSPSPTSGVPLDHDLDSQPEPPIIHSMVTSSPTDNEQLAAMPFVTHFDLVVPLDASFTKPPPSEVEPELSPVPESSPLDTHTDAGPVPESIALETSAPSAKHDLSIHTETPTPTGPPSDTVTDIGHASESPAPDSPPPDTIGSESAAQEPSLETGETELPEKVTDIPKEKESPSSFKFGRADTSAEEGNGLRRRNVAPTMTSEEDDDDEEVEFKLAEGKGGKKGFSMNTCIVAALVLLCLGSLFLSDDSDELSGAEQNQDWLNDPQKMKELLDKLTQENHQISQLETQLQAHKEELDSALNAGSATGNENRKGDLEQENTMKEELSSLPGLKEELESLRARVTELSQLTAANQDTAPLPSSPTPPPTGQLGINNQSSTTVVPERRSDLREGARVKEELQRQKVLLEESRKRLEGRKKDEGYQKRVRESLADIQRRLSEQVEKMGRSEGKKKPWESRNKDGKKGKDHSKGHWKKEEKEWKGEKYWKHCMEGRWKEKDERDWKTNKENSHKEACKKSQDKWEREKNERRLDRDKRKQERLWQSRKDYKKESNHHQQDSNYQEQHQPHQYEHTSFWKHQEEKLGRKVRPLAGCSSVEDCASQEGLVPVELSEFEELLDGYLSKLEGAMSDSKAEIQKLAAMFFRDGVFVHDKVLFSDFVEDVADILEDMVDILEDDDSLEEAMEEFEREALWKFAATT
uniref:pre-B-cell leukemia transcription factor-interacting protein 1-like isoform X1 n=2 Tax=Oncorhynchus gorbuscha TaxID=8017 RepID=UPI001EAEDB99|nr:pre-B-cell leukemia transcription factor-interacting protein 1-like isoform X1 [Oncorhynchus gorbuscha]XP_046182329.1 pre-B-cell leukemia transcription factor-interacting protein 1-like isoform X1 [Oncorhynchus gorbuscha]XP_046182330.1 pre-B-cell leukemia transcription factor-interacting protein 1-like isoform X1 [Oncorhynchus gorbuscha]